MAVCAFFPEGQRGCCRFFESVNSWNDPRNAEIYDSFARKHRIYRDTSVDLVDLADIPHAGLVVDLACGTGVTAGAILERLAPAARLIAIDGSEAMSKVAQRQVPDSRVRWMVADGSSIATHVRDADAILCNSAIWQMDVEKTIRACADALRSGGRLVFNISRGLISNLPAPSEARPRQPPWPQVIRMIAVRRFGFTAGPGSVAPELAARTRLTLDGIARMLKSAGLVPDVAEGRLYDVTEEGELDWFRVPVFADNVLPGMPYERQLQVLEAASAQIDESIVRKKCLWVFAAHKP